MIERVISLPFCHLVVQSSVPGYIAQDVLGDNSYAPQSNRKFLLKLGDPLPLAAGSTYRTWSFRKGLYLGHNMGPPAGVYVGDDTISLLLQEPSPELYATIIWSFALKLALTLTSLESGALHLKGLAARKADASLLVLGRGGAGKTTMSKTLSQIGYDIVANTHCVWKDGHLWGVNTWVRHRLPDQSDAYVIPKQIAIQDADLRRIIVYEYNNCGQYVSREIDKSLAKALVTFFSAGIANYDLKEDIVDYSTANNHERYRLLQKEQALVDQLIETYPLQYMSCDMNEPHAVDLFLNDLSA